MYRKRYRFTHYLPGKHGTRFRLWLPTVLTVLFILVLICTLLPKRKTNANRARCVGPPPVRVFVHLHKTGGNNLKVALAGFAKRNGLKLYHTCHRAVPDALLQRLWFRRHKAANGTDCNLDEFAQLPRRERLAFDFVSGHQGIGAHSLLRPRETLYFTFLRDPLRRKVSHYAHFEASRELRARIVLPAAPNADIPAAAAADREQLRRALRAEQPRIARYLLHENRNYMVKRLAGGEMTSEIAADVRARLVDASVFVGRSALRAAQKNLQDRFFFVGVQERYLEGLCILAHILNDACYASLGDGQLRRELRFGKVAKSSVNRRKTSRTIIDWLPESLANATRTSEELDVRLYKFAESLFQKQLSHFPQCKEPLK